MYVCLDVGGSSIKTGVLTREGDLLSTSKLPRPLSFDSFVNGILQYVDECRSKYEINGLAICAPGSIEVETGYFRYVHSYPFLQGRHMKTELEELTGLSVSIENDANCAALSEVYFGKLQHVKDMAFIVSGSGIGGALVKDKKVHRGANLFAGEIGGMICNWVDGRPIGLSEAAATVPAVDRAKAVFNDPTINGEWLFDHADAGEPQCVKIVDDFYLNLATCAFNVQQCYDPEYVLLGGGICARPGFIDRVNSGLDFLTSFMDENGYARPMIALCSYGKDANLYGALAHHLYQ